MHPLRFLLFPSLWEKRARLDTSITPGAFTRFHDSTRDIVLLYATSCVKFSVCTECYRSMHDVMFRIFVLKNVYQNMVSHRLRRRKCYYKLLSGPVRLVAEKLNNIKLAKLFIEAQFHAMPPDFCMRTFGKKYPPLNVVFGGECWRRYKDYIERGVRDAT